MKTLCLLFTALVSVTNAQTTPVPEIEKGACYVLSNSTKKGPDAEYLKLRCQLEKELVKKAIREAKKNTPTTAGSIGVASKNVAVTTVTYRDNTGRAFEGSREWARHKEKIADIDRKKEVGVARAENPGCGWLGCASGYYGDGYNYGYGGNYGFPYYGGSRRISGGEGGINTTFGTGR